MDTKPIYNVSGVRITVMPEEKNIRIKTLRVWYRAADNRWSQDVPVFGTGEGGIWTSEAKKDERYLISDGPKARADSSL